MSENRSAFDFESLPKEISDKIYRLLAGDIDVLTRFRSLSKTSQNQIDAIITSPVILTSLIEKMAEDRDKLNKFLFTYVVLYGNEFIEKCKPAIENVEMKRLNSGQRLLFHGSPRERQGIVMCSRDLFSEECNIRLDEFKKFQEEMGNYETKLAIYNKESENYKIEIENYDKECIKYEKNTEKRTQSKSEGRHENATEDALGQEVNIQKPQKPTEPIKPIKPKYKLSKESAIKLLLFLLTTDISKISDISLFTLAVEKNDGRYLDINQKLLQLIDHQISIDSLSVNRKLLNLNGIDFTKIDFQNEKVRNRFFESANFSHLDISKLEFSIALTNVNCTGANLTDSVLKGKIYSTDFSYANMNGCKIGDKLENVNFFKANLTNAKIVLELATNINLNGANLTNAILSLKTSSKEDIKNIFMDENTKLDNLSIKFSHPLEMDDIKQYISTLGNAVYFHSAFMHCLAKNLIKKIQEDSPDKLDKQLKLLETALESYVQIEKGNSFYKKDIGTKIFENQILTLKEAISAQIEYKH